MGFSALQCNAGSASGPVTYDEIQKLLYGSPDKLRSEILLEAQAARARWRSRLPGITDAQLYAVSKVTMELSLIAAGWLDVLDSSR